MHGETIGVIVLAVGVLMAKYRVVLHSRNGAGEKKKEAPKDAVGLHS